MTDPARLAAENAELLSALWAIVQSPASSPWARMRAKAGIQSADRVRGGAVPPDDGACLAAAWIEYGGEAGEGS